METRELEYFTVIAEEKNLSHAARKLYVGQPTLTKYIQKIEKETGTALFVKTGKQLQLTYAGKRYFDYAQRILSLKHEMENEMHEIRNSESGELHVGMPSVRCSIVLPRVLPAFHDKYPKVKFRITEASSASLDQALLDGTIDLAFYNLNVPGKNLVYETLSEDKTYAVLCKGHPLGEKAVLTDGGERCISLSMLADEIFMVQKLSQRQGELMRMVFRENHFVPAQIQEHSNIRAALALAAGGYGVAFINGGFRAYFQKEYDFECYLLKEAVSPVRFVAARRKGTYVPQYAKDFIEMVRNCSKR